MKKFNEDTRVKIPATIQFMRLGYHYQSLFADDVNIDFGTKIFINRFKPAIEKINCREFSSEEIDSIIRDIDKLINYNDLGKAFYNRLIKPGDKAKLIDFDNIENNDFAVVDELPFAVIENSEAGSFRPDINVLINGIPLAFLEVKPPNNEGGIQKEFNRMIDDRLKDDHYKKFFNLIQVVSFSNNMEYEDETEAYDVKAGSFYTTLNGNKTTFSFFREQEYNYYESYKYKKIDDDKIKNVLADCGYDPSNFDTPEFQENLKVDTPCGKFITSLYDKERFMYILHYGFLFVKGKVPEKHIMRYPQFFATRNIIKRLDSGDKRGIIWHTQGSGKTAIAAFSNRIITDYYAKKGTNVRFFYIVDRISLLKQATDDFNARDIHTEHVTDKSEFQSALNKTLPDRLGSDSIGDICVVNIQKIDIDTANLHARNDYNVKVQRIFFVDEAHRSYSKGTGSFFKNLMLCDENGAYIALTGTPLLSNKDRTTLRFGDYIDTYFYDKSIADGYTLKIKKEKVDTIVDENIKNNISIETDKLKDSDIYESDAYIADLGKFIEQDYIEFQKCNENDKYVGGMIVCKSNPQAKKMYDWFKNNTSLSMGLVLSDPDNREQEKDNERFQVDFRKPSDPDNPINLLVVHYMLTTGYDADRLKKLYLLRDASGHSLLQTISRVNRPYIAPNGRKYNYGYLVDFADIDQSYNLTLEEYTKELERAYNDCGEGMYSLAGLLDDVESIHARYLDYMDELESMIPTDNMEIFSQRLNQYDKDGLFGIRKLLNNIKDCETEFLISRSNYANETDLNKIKRLLSLTQRRIDFLNLKGDPVETLSILSDDEVVEITYEFVKNNPVVLDLGAIASENPEINALSQLIRKISESLKANKNKDDVRVRQLDDLLKEAFERLSMYTDYSNTQDVLDELDDILNKISDINQDNEKLSEQYGGQYAFVKTIQDSLDKYHLDEETLEKVMDLIYQNIGDLLQKEALKMLGRNNFVKKAKKSLTPLLEDDLYEKINGCYGKLLEDLYSNVMVYE